MQSQIDYLEGQLKERDSLLSGAQRRLKLTEGAIEELHLSSIGGVATGLPLGEGAVAAVAEDGTIASSSEESYVGQSFEDIVGSGLARGFDESLYQNSRSTQWYMGSQGLGYLRAAEVGYVRVSRTGKYQIMAAMSSNAMFALRPWIMGGLSALFAALFALVYAQASILLREVVVHNIDETNETLALITQGDLSKSVNVNSPAEFARLASGINATVGSLKDAIAAEAARIDRDLATARAIQEGALPRTFPPFPEIQAFDVYASMDAAREVGGDFYDMFLVGEHTVFLLIADVSGKGIPASLFMMAAKTQISNAVSAGMELSEAIKTANWHLCQGNEAGMFVTVWAALFDYETGELTYVNAGHNFPLLRHNGTWQWLREKGGLFLGAFDSAKFRSSSITLEPGDELLLYTDGVNEAFSAADEQYGDDRLEAFLNNHAELHPRALSDALRADLARWAKGAEQSDDITMLALEYGVPPQATGSLTVPAKMEHLDDVLNLVHGELAQRNCPISVQSQLDIVVEELFVNICSYAYEDAEKVGDCRIDYVYNTNPSSLSLAITDWGVPFDPLEHQDPDKPHSAEDAAIGGLGIMMVKRMCDDVSYHRDGDANVVLLRKDW
ncbi:MAG: SpoIIE family protein phosphatase [Atopobiaceae bacterium]|nr:SpoIIE family protein phosphatase [Atopobiaceae bacterium]